MKNRQFGLPKDTIVSQARDFDNLVVIGVKNGEPHFLSSADEQQTQGWLDSARQLESTG